MSRIGDNRIVRDAKIHPKAREAIQTFQKVIRQELGELLFKLQLGVAPRMPKSRPMPLVGQGVHELRVKDSSGICRAFYYLKSEDGILVFHAFAKRTQKTDADDIAPGRRRLKEMLTHGKES